jgi:adenylate cyclase
MTAMRGEAVAGAIVFTDIVGFTELTDLHGDDAALSLLDRQNAIVTRTLPLGARVIKELGDGLLLWFDDAVSSLSTALDLQDRFAADGHHDVPLWVRIAVHWGAPRRRGEDIIGHDVNLAARIADLAGAGEVLCSGSAAAAAGVVPSIRFDSLGSVFMKGVSEPVPLFRVCRGRQT